MPKIMIDPDKEDIISDTSTLPKNLFNKSNGIKFSFNVKKTTISKVYGKNVRIVSYDDYLRFVEDEGLNKKVV